MMKTCYIIGMSTVLSTYLAAGSLDFQNGWNLKGADKQISVSELECAKAIWKYDNSNSSNPWKVHHKYITSHGYDTFTTINQGEGFWVLGENCDGNSGVVDPQTIHAFGFEWRDRKFDKINDPRYQVNGNTIKLTSDNKIELLALKDSGNESRTEILTTIPPSKKIESTINITDGASSYNFAQFNALFYNATWDQTLNTNFGTSGWIYAGISIKSNSAYFWIEVGDNQGEIVFDTSNINTEIVTGINLSNKNIYLSTEVIPNGVRFTVNDGINTYTKDYLNSNINFDFINSVRFRSRVDDNKAIMNNQTANNQTVIKVENFVAQDDSIVYADSDTLTPNFTALPTNFISLFDDKHEKNSYEKVTNNITTFNFVEYEYEKNDSDNSYLWEMDSDAFNLTVNLDANSFNYTTPSNEQGTFTAESLKKVLFIHENPYSGSGDLYELIAQREVSNMGDVEWETADWTPKSYNNGQVTTITNIIDFVNDSLTTGNWFDHASGGGVNMLTGNIGETSGNVVRGVADGIWDGCTEGDCTKYVRTNEVIGSWTLNNNELKVESNESDEIHWSRYTNSTFEQGWQSKVGSTEKHKFYYSNSDDITEIENFIKTVIQNHPYNN